MSSVWLVSDKEEAINKRKLLENRRVSHAECLFSI